MKKLPIHLKVIEKDAEDSVELIPVRNPKAAMVEFLKISGKYGKREF